MDYTIDCGYRWYIDHNSANIVLMFFICGIPFTFNELSKDLNLTLEIVREANYEMKWDVEMLYEKSVYLIEEQCHPLLFSLDIENPEILDFIEGF